VGKVVSMADWLPNVATPQSEAFYQAFRQRFPNPTDDSVHRRMQLIVQALLQANEAVFTMDLVAIAVQLESSSITFYQKTGSMRVADQQFQQTLVVGVMDKKGTSVVNFDVGGSDYGFRVIKTVTAQVAQAPTSCKMQRP
jgi:branched-chain amino acid transport system substrate-binding protein